VEFGKHIGKGLWAFADKALPAIYGVGFIFFVIRILPETQFGAFALVQTMFLIVSSSLYALTIQPLVKFIAEGKSSEKYLMASLILQVLSFCAVSLFILLWADEISALLDPDGVSQLAKLMAYLPPMLAFSYYRSLVLSIMQAKYLIRSIFFVDAAYFLGMLAAYVVVNYFGKLSEASDILSLNLICLSFSGIVAYVLSKGILDYRGQYDKSAMLEFWNYSKFNFGGSLTSLLFSQADTFIVSAYLGILPTATYSAMKIFNKIFDVLNQVIQMFLVPFSAKRDVLKSNAEMKSVAGKTIAFSSLLLLPLLISMVAMPHALIQLLYGDRYSNGAGALQLFGLFGLIVPWNSVIVSYLQGFGRVREGFYAGICLLLLAFGLYCLLTPIMGFAGTALGMLISFFLFTEGLRRYLSRMVNIRISDVVVRLHDAVTFAQNLRKNLN
jgi:O-antigen/teichoic acid export membrane protein